MKIMVQNTFQNLKMFFCSLRAFGLAPYEFDSNTLKFEMKRKNYVFLAVSIFSSVLSSWAALSNFYGTIYVTEIRSKLLDRLWQSTFLIESFLMVFTIVFNFWRRENIQNFVTLISKFDQTLYELSWEKKPSTIPWCFRLMVMFNVSTVLGLIYYIISTFFVLENDRLIQCLKLEIFHLTNAFFLLVGIQFILCVYSVHSRVESLKENLK